MLCNFAQYFALNSVVVNTTFDFIKHDFQIDISFAVHNNAGLDGQRSSIMPNFLDVFLHPYCDERSDQWEFFICPNGVFLYV